MPARLTTRPEPAGAAGVEWRVGLALLPIPDWAQGFVLVLTVRIEVLPAVALPMVSAVAPLFALIVSVRIRLSVLRSIAPGCAGPFPPATLPEPPPLMVWALFVTPIVPEPPRNAPPLTVTAVL